MQHKGSSNNQSRSYRDPILVGLCCPLSVKVGYKNKMDSDSPFDWAVQDLTAVRVPSIDIFPFSHLNRAKCCGTVLQRDSAGF